MVLVGFAIAAIEYSPLREPGDLLFDIVVLIGLWAVGRLAASWVISRDRALALEFERGQVEERAATSERTRIARELHDLISRTITVIVMQAGGGRLAAASDPGAAVETLTRIEMLGRESLAELRTLLAVLHPEEPDGGETAPQPTLADLEQLCDRMRAAGVPVRLRVAGDLTGLPLGVQLAGYRIVQEALTNVVKHAGAVETNVSLERGEIGGVTVEVSSASGVAGALPSGSRGLAGMRERVSALGGTLVVDTHEGGAFTITAALPEARQ